MQKVLNIIGVTLLFAVLVSFFGNAAYLLIAVKDFNETGTFSSPLEILQNIELESMFR